MEAKYNSHANIRCNSYYLMSEVLRGCFCSLVQTCKNVKPHICIFHPSPWSSWRQCEKRKAWTEPDADEKWFLVGCGRLWYADVWMMTLRRGEQRLLDTCSDLTKEEMCLMLKDCLKCHTVWTPDMMRWTLSLPCQFVRFCAWQAMVMSVVSSYFCSAS